MSKNPLYPDPPHISLASYLDQPDPDRVLYSLCEVLTAAGAAGTGVCQLVRGEKLPAFEMISDLADRLERSTCDLGSTAGRREWERLIAGQDPTAHVLKAGFNASPVGTVVVTLQPAGAEPRHPVAVDVSGALLDMAAASPFLSQRDRRRAEAVGQWIGSLFRHACETLDPLYASVLAEAWLPVPAQLAAGDARLGTEVYLSDRLEAAAPGTQDALAHLYARGHIERASTGQVYSGWGALNPQKRTVPEPLSLGRKAAAVVGRALAARASR
jgi:hypothetical protein